MKVSRRDFEAMANALKAHRAAMVRTTPTGECREFFEERFYVLCRCIAQNFAVTNPAFKKERFLEACEVDKKFLEA